MLVLFEIEKQDIIQILFLFLSLSSFLFSFSFSHSLPALFRVREQHHPGTEHRSDTFDEHVFDVQDEQCWTSVMRTM